MIIRCLACHSPILHNGCLCGEKIIRCPDCGGDGRQKIIEFLEDGEGYMGYMLLPCAGKCETCGGIGRVKVSYLKVK